MKFSPIFTGESEGKKRTRFLLPYQEKKAIAFEQARKKEQFWKTQMEDFQFCHPQQQSSVEHRHSEHTGAALSTDGRDSQFAVAAV
jgi:hypothetical protein